MTQVISEHLFIFPFSWKCGYGSYDPIFRQHNAIKGKRFAKLNGWQEHLSTIESFEDYNEYVYFYKPIRLALYTFSGKPVIVRNYDYVDLDETRQLKIVVGNELYELKLEKIDLKLYKTGIGLLCFRVLNDKYKDKEAIRAINAFSCTVYPPVMPVEKARARGFPRLIEIRLNAHKVIKEDFSEVTFDESLSISPLIMEVLGKPFSSKLKLNMKESIHIEPIMGYQMFCCCMYYAPQLIKETETEKALEEEMEGWMQISYMEVGKKKWEDEAIKPSFIASGSYLYGVSRRMLFGVVPAYPCEKLYDQLVKLVLMQRATLLNLSTEIARISTLPKSEISPAISSIYEIYIQFINQLYFKEVTEDGEGSRLYDQLSQLFKIEEELNQLNFEVDEVHEYALLVEQSASNLKVQMLTIIGAALVLPSFVTGFFGMNIFQEEALHWWRHQAVALWLNSYVVFPILAVVAICIWSKRRTPISLLMKVLLSLLLLTSMSFTLKYGCGL